MAPWRQRLTRSPEAAHPHPAITPRNVRFAFAEALPVDWHSGDPAISRFYDALSLTFPEGERFFVDSVRPFADGIADPAFRRDVEAFIAQESIHAREHAAYNCRLGKAGVPVEKFDRLIAWFARFVKRHLSARNQLAATCAYEHYTALFAERILGEPRVMAGAHPLYRDLWRWHAMEEQEHKAVAFEVYRLAAPGWRGYLRRVVVMSIATLDFTLGILALQAWLMAKRGDFWNLRSWGRAHWHLWVVPGVWRHVMLGVFAYLRPGFHPASRRLPPGAVGWAARYRAPPSGLRDGGTGLFDSP